MLVITFSINLLAGCSTGSGSRDCFDKLLDELAIILPYVSAVVMLSENGHSTRTQNILNIFQIVSNAAAGAWPCSAVRLLCCAAAAGGAPAYLLLCCAAAAALLPSTSLLCGVLLLLGSAGLGSLLFAY